MFDFYTVSTSVDISCIKNQISYISTHFLNPPLKKHTEFGKVPVSQLPSESAAGTSDMLSMRSCISSAVASTHSASKAPHFSAKGLGVNGGPHATMPRFPPKLPGFPPKEKIKSY